MKHTYWIIALCCLALPAWAGNGFIASRVWPSNDYSRITLESAQAMRYTINTLANSQRIELKLQDLVTTKALFALPDKIIPTDPFIKSVQVSQIRPSLVHLVVELKVDAIPKVFALSPSGNYRHRLVLDIYPSNDSLGSFISNIEGVARSDAIPKASDSLSPPTPSWTRMPANEAQKNSTRPVVIVIDAGHGGEDPGARGASGSYEKDITLAIALKLKDRINDEPDMRGLLTRDGDYFIPLRGRVMKARKLQADIFISIHADAFIKRDARGSSVFALSEKGGTSLGARWLVSQEMLSESLGGVSLNDKEPMLAKTLFDLSQTATINDSLKLGKVLLEELDDINVLHKKKVEQAGFAVLKSPDIPSVLIETAFISNPEEEQRLNDENYQNKLVNSILTGIRRYVETRPPFSNTLKVELP